MRILIMCGAILVSVGVGAQGNPIMRGADPDVLLVDGVYWLYATGGQGQFFVRSSTDLATWERHGPILRFADVTWIPLSFTGQRQRSA